jgi:hypothetical protein
MGLFDFWKKNESAGLLEKGISDSAKAAPSPTAFEIDPHNYFSAYMHEDTTGSFHSGTNGLDYSTLLLMARQPVVSAIINTRINQVADFSQPQRSPYDLGFKIELKDYKKEPTPEQEKKIEELQKWMSTCGDDRIAFDNTFENFLRKIVRDSLIYDQCCFEIVRRFYNSTSSPLRERKKTREARPAENSFCPGNEQQDLSHVHTARVVYGHSKT